MTQLVRVQKCNPDGTALVVHIRESACSGDCHKCSGCGAAKETIFLTAVNPIGAKPGDVVNVTSESGPVLLGAAVLYMVPMLLFFVGYYIGAVLWNLGGITGAVAFALGIALAVVYDRKFAGKKKTIYTITGYAHYGCEL